MKKKVNLLNSNYFPLGQLLPFQFFILEHPWAY